MQSVGSTGENPKRIKTLAEDLKALKFARSLGEAGSAEEDNQPSASWRWQCLRPNSHQTIVLAVDTYCIEDEPLSGVLTIFGDEFELDAILIAVKKWTDMNAESAAVAFGEGDKFITVRFSVTEIEPGANGLLSYQSFICLLGDLRNLVNSGEFWYQVNTFQQLYTRRILTASAVFSQHFNKYRQARLGRVTIPDGVTRETRRTVSKAIE